MKEFVKKRGGVILFVLLLVVRFGVFTYKEKPEIPLVVNTPVLQIEDSEHMFDVKAKSYVVYDIDARKVLYEKNKDTQLPLASLTKLMTALIVSQRLQNKVVAMTPNSLEREGDSGFFEWENFNLRDLINFTLVSSSNDGASALAGALGSPSSFVGLMNKKAQDLALNQTYFLNETGLDMYEESVSGGYGSAYDVALLLSYIVRHDAPLLEATQDKDITITSTGGLEHNASNTNEIVEDIPWLVGSKTGYTDLAGGNLGVVFDAGPHRPVAVVVLGSTKESRFEDVEALIRGVMTSS